MSLFTRLVRNSLWLLSARVGAQVFMIGSTFLLAHRLGTTGFGEYAFIASVILIGNTLTTFGSDMYLIREIAARADFSDLSSVLLLQLLLSVLFIACVFGVAPYLPNQTHESALALRVYSLALIPLAFFTVFTSMLRGTQKMTSYAWINFSLPAAQVIAILVFVQPGTDIVTLAYLLLAIQVLGAVLGGLFCIPFFPGVWKDFHFSLAALNSIFLICLPIALIAIVGIVYQRLSLTMLSFLGTASMMGIFSAATRVVEAARLGHFAVFTALYPAMANAAQNQSSRRTFRTTWLLLLAGSALGSILLYLLAKPLVEVLFGSEYISSIPVLKILVLTLIPYTVNSFLSLRFLAAEKEKVVLRIFVVSLFVLFILNLWLIPRAGEVGAGWAGLVAETIQAILFLLAWLKSPFRQTKSIRSQGASYELSDLS